MYIHVPTGKYPVKESQIRSQYPNTSFAKPFVPPGEYQKVDSSEQPAHDSFSQTVVEAQPLLISGVWVQQWTVRSATADEMESRKNTLVADVTNQTQQRLDLFAQTRGYDGILSACTYVTSAVSKFQVEGQYCVESRDATWAKLYEIMAEVEAGTRPMPSGYADIEGDLPALVWPV